MIRKERNSNDADLVKRDKWSVAICGMCAGSLVTLLAFVCHLHLHAVRSDPQPQCTQCPAEAQRGAVAVSDALCCVTQINDTVNQVFATKLQEIKRGSMNESRRVFLDHSSATDFITAHKISAHLVGGHSPQTSVPQRGPRICTWNHQHHLSFLKNGVRFRDNRLIIPLGGEYYVYSHVRFARQPSQSKRAVNGTTSLKIKQFLHRIFRYNVRYPNTHNQLLLYSINSKPCEEAGYCEESSHLSAALHLRAGDEIFVTVSDDNVSQFFSTVNNFGLFQL